jgi:hypothetical protein
VNNLHGALALTAALLATGAGIVDRSAAAPVAFISAPELAGRIMRGDQTLHVFDLRAATDFDAFHVPTARRVDPNALDQVPVAPEWSLVVYGDNRETLARAVRGLRRRPHHDLHVLRDGVFEWLARVHEPRLAVDATDAERREFDQAAALSRFFGGQPQAGVSRPEVPLGYWTGTVRSDELLMQAATRSVASIRRRGC